MTTKIVVAAAMCTPARVRVSEALQPYGVRFEIGGVHWGDYGGRFVRGADDAFLQVAEVLVNDQAAKWAEYLLLRSGKLQLVSWPLDRRNEGWALKWGGAMPKPWVEAGCDVKAQPAPTVDKPQSHRGNHRPVRQARRREQRKERY